MKIAYIITGLGVGGAEVVTIDIANRMAQNNNEVMLLYLTGKNAHEHRISPNVNVVGLNMQKTPLGFIKSLFKARSILKKLQPDIIHAHMFHACIFARVLRLIFWRQKLICTEHNKNIEGSFRMKLYRYSNSLSNFNTNVSREAVDYFIEQKAFKLANSKVVYNGIELSRFKQNTVARQTIRQQYGLKDTDFLFITIGRLTEAKDHHNLIAAFSVLRDAKLMIVGVGDLLDSLKTFAEEKGVSNNLIFAGGHTNVEDFYNAADCFVLSSAWEGLPIVFLEAMASSLPIITTDISDCKFIIGDDFVVPIRNSSQLANKMQHIQAMSSEERQAIGLKNREKANMFDVTYIVSEWMTIYSTVAHK